MGTFTVAIQLEGPTGKLEALDALVDTGATYAVVSADTLARLDVATLRRRSFELADERVVEYDVGEVRLRLDGEQLTVLTVFGPEGSRTLIGATTLELFGLAVDPVAQRLVPVRGLLK